MRRAAKRDQNEAAIVKALRTAGLHVIHADQPWDLVCSWGGYVKLAEVKAPRNKNNDPETFSDAQQKTLASWQGQIDVLVTEEQALEFAEALKAEARLLNAARAMGRVA